MSPIKRAYGYVTWRSKHLYRLLAVFSGPFLFWVFSAWQAVMIGRYLADLGWHWCPAWPLAIVIGFIPFLGSLVAAKVTADVGWMGFWTATAIFLAPFWLFALVALPGLSRKTFGPPARRPLRLSLASRPLRTGDEGAIAGAR